MRPLPIVASSLFVVVTSVVVVGCSPSSEATERVVGQSIELGNGTVSTYAEFDGGDLPTAIGVVYSSGALEGLPTEPSDQHHCFDRDGDGRVEVDSECIPTHEFVIPLPDAVSKRSDVPFKWALFNWNPAGHIPPGIYDVPHFDVHFYMVPIASVFALEDGPCGLEFIRCDQHELAKKPLPPNYMSPDFQDVDAVVPAMGNHLIDVTGPEFAGEEWKRSWIFGVYDGEVIFYEEMLTRAFMLSLPNACYPIKSPPAVGRSGFYPTKSCIRHDPETGEHTVSIEGFEFREASAPEPVAG
ncbi:MAG: hypothetical protein GTN62_07055 [Gemmatimonadales bacterium]|nr:hypothetical protein [Gemmatimonadales bacterium]NIN11258.1 hypothetical protein [Gemmatimonadales bacterium]NIN49857.1 hypothetical protein [Gemmatimonadales bacterium]NIP07321.1 hypothetical protein [Gemmatimonadales bacterium]NIR03016.1 hypothetical protein [Gemmatimonadales bacterium]